MRIKNQPVDSKAIDGAYQAAARQNEDELIRSMDTSSDGLSSTRVKALITQYGANVIDHGRKKTWLWHLYSAFANPFIIVLIVIAVVSLITDVILPPPSQRSITTVLIVTGMMLLSGMTKFIQEYRSGKAAARLKNMISSSANVMRDGKQKEIPISQVVPGDIVLLSAGDILPADVRILEAKDLFVNQATLTGESAPVEKYPDLRTEAQTIMELSNICFMGTNIASGSARALVLKTGNSTYVGIMAKSLSTSQTKTSFEKGINSVSRLLIFLMAVMVPIVFLLNGLLKNDWLGAFLFAISVAVGLTPEMMPMILSVTLAKGAIAMSRKKTIVKNINSIQNFGAMDILCTDKTGTLTENKIIIEKYLDIYGQEDIGVLKHAYLNSHFQTGMKNILDIAIINRAETNKINDILKQYTKVDEIPFDFGRRRMSVVLQKQDGSRELITKGAVEEMLSICRFGEYQGNMVELTDELRTKAIALSDSMNGDGLRVIAIAQKNEVPDAHTFGIADESDMVLMGFVGFLDPPKASAAAAVKELSALNVRLVVLTGDNELVAKQICKQVGIDANEVAVGMQIDSLDDTQLQSLAERINLFAKLTPMQKARVVKALQAKGHTVGYMGDGINDALALNQSDVGISVEDAVDIAKETADIILLEKSLHILIEGVTEGRRTFGNILKYIKMAASSNFGNMFSVLAASALLPFLPMLPVQILAQNLLYDFSQLAIPLDRMDKEYIQQPRKWDAKGIRRFILRIGPLSSIFDIITFLVLAYVFGANTIEKAALFQTGWFIEGILSQTLIVHLIRTPKLPFIQSRAAWPLFVSTGLIAVIALLIVLTPAGGILGFVLLPGVYYACLAGILFGYFAVVQAAKVIFIRHYREWI